VTVTSHPRGVPWAQGIQHGVTAYGRWMAGTEAAAVHEIVVVVAVVGFGRLQKVGCVLWMRCFLSSPLHFTTPLYLWFESSWLNPSYITTNMHFPSFLAAALVATVTALPTGEVKAQTQDPQVAGYGIRPVGQYHGVAQLGTYRRDGDGTLCVGCVADGICCSGEKGEEQARCYAAGCVVWQVQVSSPRRDKVCDEVMTADGWCSPYAEYSTYKSYPPGAEGAEGAEGQAPEMKRDAAMETV
jgi:hypothetical protein